MTTPTTGDRVRWTYTDTVRGKPVEGTVEGTIVDRPTQFGRVAVLADDGTEHHVQPAWVTVLDTGSQV